MSPEVVGSRLKRWDEAGRPDIIKLCLATGCRPNDTMLRLLARQRLLENTETL